MYIYIFIYIATEIENYVMRKSSVSDELILRYIHTAGEIATIGISESDENILSKLNIKSTYIYIILYILYST